MNTRSLLLSLSLYYLILHLGSPQIINSDPPNFTYQELYRPGYHYTPPFNWMNDPNGLVFANGVYHLYYQCNPYGNQWGNLSWGHAISKDLIYWETLPVAIYETEEYQIWSGSAIVDVNNTSGVCEEAGCTLAFYTQRFRPIEKQAQGVAFSDNEGLSYKQFEGNPLIDLWLKDFRDPKVFWYELEKKWIMVVALSTQFRILFYSSKNLLNWELMSEFGSNEGSKEGVWETPDFFELEIEGQNTKKWVLAHAVDTARMEYYIGEFNGTTFINTETKEGLFFIDYGRDFSEATTWNNEPKGRRLMIAWFNEGLYAHAIPTYVWRCQQSLIRELRIREFPEGLRLVSGPIEEIKKLRYSKSVFRNWLLDNSRSTKNLVKGTQVEIIAEFVYNIENPPIEFGFQVFYGENQETILGYNVQLQELYIDRQRSGNVDFHPDFGNATIRTGYSANNGRIEFHIFLDNSSVEMFIDKGNIAMSSQIFPDPKKNQVRAYVTGGKVILRYANTWYLKNIWVNNTKIESIS